jgi:prophage antirepressor-like protein
MHQLAELFENKKIVFIELPNEPDHLRYWFRASEVCKVLKFSNAFEAITQHCKQHQYREFQLGKGRPSNYVSESGVYRLLLRSKAPIAVDFQDWLTEEVLPKLRSRGVYVMPNATVEQLQAEVVRLCKQREDLVEDKMYLESDFNGLQLECNRLRSRLRRYEPQDRGDRTMRQNNRLTSGVQVGC